MGARPFIAKIKGEIFKMKRTKTAFRLNAYMAKKRLGGGFWQKQHTRLSLENINNPNCEEEQFYRRVENIIKMGCENPLEELLDYTAMQSMDDATRQRYVLNMSQKVQNSVARYNLVC